MESHPSTKGAEGWGTHKIKGKGSGQECPLYTAHFWRPLSYIAP